MVQRSILDVEFWMLDVLLAKKFVNRVGKNSHRRSVKAILMMNFGLGY